MGMANGERMSKKGKGSMKKCPLLLMSDFYHIAGKADDLLELYEEDTEMKTSFGADPVFSRRGGKSILVIKRYSRRRIGF